MVPYVRLIPVEPPGHKHGSAAEDGQLKKFWAARLLTRTLPFTLIGTWELYLKILESKSESMASPHEPNQH